VALRACSWPRTERRPELDARNVRGHKPLVVVGQRRVGHEHDALGRHPAQERLGRQQIGIDVAVLDHRQHRQAAAA